MTTEPQEPRRPNLVNYYLASSNVPVDISDRDYRTAAPVADCRGTHRGPQGPNEDLAQCFACRGISHSMRPAGETFGHHLPDCSLPIDHESYCQPGGAGHEPAAKIRG